MKLNFNDVIGYFKKYNINVLIKPNEYKNTKEKLFVIDEHNYLGLVSFDVFRTDKSFKPFSSHNPYTIQNIQTYINNNNIGCKILSEKYEGLNENLLFECDCGNLFEVSWHHFKCSSQTKCRKCNLLSYREKRCNTFDDLQNVLDEQHCKLINGEFLNNKSRLAVVDKDGYKGITCYSRLKQGIVPMRFHTQNPYTIENIKNYIKINKLNCRLLSIKYEDNKKDKLEFVCSCGEHFYASLDYFIRTEKTRCDKCMKNKSNIEFKTENWLIENNIDYIFQYRIDDCRYKRALPFDFAIFKNNEFFGLIEVDGAQHDSDDGALFFSKNISEERLLENKIRDKIKTDYCKNNKIKLLRLRQFYFRNDRYIKELKSFIFEDI